MATQKKAKTAKKAIAPPKKATATKKAETVKPPVSTQIAGKRLRATGARGYIHWSKVRATQAPGTFSIVYRSWIKLFHSDGQTAEHDYYNGQVGAAFKHMHGPVTTLSDCWYESPTGKGRGEYWNNIDGLGDQKTGGLHILVNTFVAKTRQPS